MKIEKDEICLVGGVRNGQTLGGPIALVIENRDWTNWKKIMDPVEPIAKDLTEKQKRLAFDTSTPRPGHADLAGGIKYNHHDLRNVLERASARETTARVAVGSIVRQLLEAFDVKIASHVVRIGEISLPDGYDVSDLDAVGKITEESPVRCIDSATGEKMMAAIDAAMKNGDSVGGVVEVIVGGLPVGLGSYVHWDRRLDGQIAQAMMSIHSVKGVGLGMGSAVGERTGSRVHDEILNDSKGPAVKKGFKRASNNAGGLEGGVTNGEHVVVRLIAKPISTLSRPLRTVNVKTREAAEAMVERTDSCVVPALAVVAEAMAAIVCANAFMEKFGSDSFDELKRHYQTYLDAGY